MKVAELQSWQLDKLVGKLELERGEKLEEGSPAGVLWKHDDSYMPGNMRPFRPASDWLHGGPIIEREQISLDSVDSLHPLQCWGARIPGTLDGLQPAGEFGSTPLIAAMRAYVASAIGDEVAVIDSK